MFAVIRTGGKQHSVEAGHRVKIEKLPGEVGGTIEFAEVLLIENGDNVSVGKPLVAGAKVSAKIVRQDKDPRVTIFKKRRRKGFHKKHGHRQPFTEVEITGITPA